MCVIGYKKIILLQRIEALYNIHKLIMLKVRLFYSLFIRETTVPYLFVFPMGRTVGYRNLLITFHKTSHIYFANRLYSTLPLATRNIGVTTIQ